MTMKLKGILTLLFVVLLGGILSVSSHLVFEPIRQEREDRLTLEILGSYFNEVSRFETNPLETIQGVEITRSLRALKADEPLGYLYEANITNEFGNMRVRITLDVRDIIQSVEFIELNQTLYQSQTRNMLNTYLLTKLETDIFDGASGATSISRKDLSRLMSALGRHHDQSDKFEFILPYVAYYGPDYVVSSTQTLSQDNATIIVETISGQGVVYTITKSGIYQTGSIEEKSITLIIALDNANNIIGIDLPVDLYNHTKGNFMRSAIAFAESFIDTNLADVTDGNTGASGDGEAHNSRVLIENMMLIIQSIHVEAPVGDSKYASYFGAGYVIESTETLNESDAVIVVETIKDLGLVYTVTKSGLYRANNTEERAITMIVILDNAGKILSVELPEDLYFHTKGSYYPQVVTFVAGYVDMMLADVVDGQAGATESGVAFNSKTLVENMMLIIQVVHSERSVYAKYYGADFEVESTGTITQSDAEIKIEIIKDLGTVYTITKAGLYRINRTDEPTITMIVILDNAGKILGVELPEDLYFHTKGSYYPQVVTFVAGYVDMMLADVVDGQAGATESGVAFNSKTLVENMMLIVQGVHAA